jgi:glycine/D-amino acid oxidase-like deaminating enzyme
MELMERALPLWRQWNTLGPRPLYHETGFLLLSRAILAPGTFEGDSIVTLEARGHEVVRLRRGSLARWPAWSDVVYIDGYFNPAAGWVESGAVVARLLEEARLAGVTIRTGEAFGRFLDSGSRVCGVITAAGDELPSDVVLVAAGAWTTTLVPELAEAMWPVAQPVFHLKPPDPDAWRPDRFTVWAADIARTGWYGFPANADGIVKIANHGPGRRVDPEAPRVTLAAEEAALQAFLHESLPALADAPLDASKTCLYSDTFDGDFWIGRDPDRAGLAVAAGDSGHGFKFAPILGEIVADAIEGTITDATRRFGWRTPARRKTEDARHGMS